MGHQLEGVLSIGLVEASLNSIAMPRHSTPEYFTPLSSWTTHSKTTLSSFQTMIGLFFLRANDWLNLYPQIIENLGFVFEKNLIVVNEMNGDSLCLVNKSLISARVSLTMIQDFFYGIEGINQAEWCREWNQQVGDNVDDCKRF